MNAAACHGCDLLALQHNPCPILASRELLCRTRLSACSVAAGSLPKCASYEMPGNLNSNAVASCSSSLKLWSSCSIIGTRRRFKLKSGAVRMEFRHSSFDSASWSSSLCLRDPGFPHDCSCRKSSSAWPRRFSRGCTYPVDNAGADQFSDALDTSPTSTSFPSSHFEVSKDVPIGGSEGAQLLGLLDPQELSTGGKRVCNDISGTLGRLASVLFALVSQLVFSKASVAIGNESIFPNVMTFAGPEPSNALSLPTWIIHVASVAEWVAAMALVWKYGETEGKSAWKGLAWGMVPLLGGAFCACTWHFFYNAESLEGLVAVQAFLTVLGNCTMWAAAYRIWKLSQ